MDAFDEVVTDPEVRLADVERHVQEAEPGAPFLGRYRIGVTSGSSARPATLVFGPDEWAALIANAAESRAVTRTGPPGRFRSVKIGSPLGWHLSAQVGASLADPRRPVLRLSATTPVPQLVSELAAWRPEALTAYASLLGLLADEQEAGRLAIAPQQVLAGAEPLTEDVRRRVRAAWAVEVFDQYAIGEVGFLAVECPAHDGLHVMDRHVVLEVVDDDHEPVADGEEGSRVLVTALTSRLVPLIRYEVPDRARLVRRLPLRPDVSPVVVSGRARDVLRSVGRPGSRPCTPSPSPGSWTPSASAPGRSCGRTAASVSSSAGPAPRSTPTTWPAPSRSLAEVLDGRRPGAGRGGRARGPGSGRQGLTRCRPHARGRQPSSATCSCQRRRRAMTPTSERPERSLGPVGEPALAAEGDVVLLGHARRGRRRPASRSGPASGSIERPAWSARTRSTSSTGTAVAAMNAVCPSSTGTAQLKKCSSVSSSTMWRIGIWIRYGKRYQVRRGTPDRTAVTARPSSVRSTLTSGTSRA